MIEPEIAFANLSDDADLAEDFLKFLFRTVLEERADDMAFFAEHIDKECIRRLESFIAASFERMDYTDAIKALEAAAAKGVPFEFPVKWGIDLQSEHERYLTETLVGRPVVVMNYPKQIKAFYMRQNDDGRTVAAMDVLAPGIGEIIGGSQREERLDWLDARLDEMGLSKEQYAWYRDLRRVWDRAPRRVRTGIRAHGRLCHGNGEYPRCDSVSTNAGECGILVQNWEQSREVDATATGDEAIVDDRSRGNCCSVTRMVSLALQGEPVPRGRGYHGRRALVLSR